MERDDVMDRVRAARPRSAVVDGDAVDGALLARVMAQGDDTGASGTGAGRRRVVVSRAVALPVAAGVTFAAAGAIMFAGGPDDVGGPSSAQAISSQTLRWLDPPAGTILHARSVETQGGVSTTRDIWVSADDSSDQRTAYDGGLDYEQDGDGSVYDPATDTIYDVAGAAPDGPKGAKGGETLPAGDPAVIKVKMLLQAGQMTVGDRQVHDGVPAWKIALKDGLGRPPWMLWVSADDGKPLELVDPGRDASEPEQVIRWSAYDVVPKSDSAAAASLTLTGAHPHARVEHDRAAAEAAVQRLTGGKG